MRPAVITDAMAYAQRLVDLAGCSPRGAAFVAARAFGLDADDIYVAHDPRLGRVWRSSRKRPTSRPSHLIDAEQETERKGAA